MKVQLQINNRNKKSATWNGEPQETLDLISDLAGRKIPYAEL